MVESERVRTVGWRSRTLRRGTAQLVPGVPGDWFLQAFKTTADQIQLLQWLGTARPEERGVVLFVRWLYGYCVSAQEATRKERGPSLSSSEVPSKSTVGAPDGVQGVIAEMRKLLAVPWPSITEHSRDTQRELRASS